jgi:hypothetical protein
MEVQTQLIIQVLSVTYPSDMAAQTLAKETKSTALHLAVLVQEQPLNTLKSLETKTMVLKLLVVPLTHQTY